MYRIATVAFWTQTFSLVVGLVGMVYVMPHFSEFSRDPNAIAFAAFMMQQGGMLDIMLGAAAMIAYGIACCGLRNTLIFLGLALVISAAAELTGTATGWPFGGYAYTDLLGAKILGRVPYPIPFSWFSMGFASYILGIALARKYFKTPIVGERMHDVTTAEGARLAFAELHGTTTPPARRDTRMSIAAVVIGAVLLTAWDLVLDPAMANGSSALAHFWNWTEHGAYFGMPLRNFVGWFATGLVFIGAARLAWREEPRAERLPLALPFGMYVVNVVWAMGLAAYIQLWIPIVLALVIGLAPAILALPLGRFTPAGTPRENYKPSSRFVA